MSGRWIHPGIPLGYNTKNLVTSHRPTGGQGQHHCWINTDQWEVQDPKSEVLYYTRLYFMGIFPDIGQKHMPGTSNKNRFLCCSCCSRMLRALSVAKCWTVFDASEMLEFISPQVTAFETMGNRTFEPVEWGTWVSNKLQQSTHWDGWKPSPRRKINPTKGAKFCWENQLSYHWNIKKTVSIRTIIDN